VRAFLFVLPAASVVLVLFLFMAQLASPPANYLTADQQSLSLDMLRMRFDSETQVRDRQLPPPPPDVPQPPVTQPKISTPSFTTDLPALDVPEVSMATAMDMAIAVPSLPSVAPPSDLSDMGDVLIGQVPKHRVNPKYPRRALQRKIQGYVVVEFKVDKEGKVVDDSLVFIESQPKGMFERSVRKSLLRWEYNPLIRNGVSVAYKTRQRLEFKLGN